MSDPTAVLSEDFLSFVRSVSPVTAATAVVGFARNTGRDPGEVRLLLMNLLSSRRVALEGWQLQVLKDA